MWITDKSFLTMSWLYKLIITAIVLEGIFCQDENTIASVTTDNETIEPEEPPEAPSEPPRFSEAGQVFNKKAGERVSLPCPIANLKESNAIPVWKHGTRYLTNGQTKFQNPAITLDKIHYTLTIRHLNSEHAGEYTCTAVMGKEPEASITHVVSIVVAPSVDVSPQDSPVTAKEGEPLQLSCKVEGTPTPSIKWVLKTHAGLLRELPDYINQSNIEISNLQRQDTGTYYCVADNGVDGPKNDSVVVYIRYAPQLEDSTSVFLSRVGGEARLQCTFSAYPLDGHTFQWYRLITSADPSAEADASAKEEIQNDGERFVIQPEAKDSRLSSTLTIRDVRAEDMRKYLCVATNEVGEAQHEVELSGLPYPVGMQTTDKRDGVRWTVKSISPVKEYRIIYREINDTHEGEPQNRTIQEDGKDSTTTEEGEVKIYERTYLFENLQPLKNYSVIVQALNEYGLSKTVSHSFSMEDLNKPHAVGQTGGASVLTSHSSLGLISLLIIMASSWNCRI